jgi:cobyrinic acid a,c-diamide synthase
MMEPMGDKTNVTFPRLVVAGLSGDSGKTLVSLALLFLARQAHLEVAAFKKGPDYIDAAWLAWASGRSARNLDTFLMGFPKAVGSFALHALPGGLNLIEGNRGLYDGSDARGTHSTAELAKALGTPVLLVVNATKVTRTLAALVLGCQKLDPEVPMAGVILNQVSGTRHERVLREAIESVTGLPVLGVLPRADTDALLPGRHLGLVTPQEHPQIESLRTNLLALTEGHLDLAGLLGIAGRAPRLRGHPETGEGLPDGRGLKIGYLKDSAFTFYYPENLEALERAGVTLEPLSALSATGLPADLDALYMGGGFPETHAARLTANRAFLESVRRAAAGGLPIYAECGGLMLLARAIQWRGATYAMAGALPIEVEVRSTPQGHGYAELAVDRPNSFFPPGTRLRGHEFHYSRILPDSQPLETACAVERGSGTYPGRDGIIAQEIWASYTHLHALATPEWAAGLLKAARRAAKRWHPAPDVE